MLRRAANTLRPVAAVAARRASNGMATTVHRSPRELTGGAEHVAINSFMEFPQKSATLDKNNSNSNNKRSNSASASASASASPGSISLPEKSQNFLDTLFESESDLPFKVPDTCWFRSVGNTPMQKLGPNLFAKLEGVNYTGSVKDRMILAIVLKMFRDGKLQNGSTLCLTTSGSAGKSLAMIQRTLLSECGVHLNCIVAMPKGYMQKPVIQELLDSGVPTFYEKPGDIEGTQLLFVDKVFMEVLGDVEKFSAENGWAILDQHHDPNGVLAHKSTAAEIMASTPNVTDVICATGTGATAAGLRKYLPDHVRVHSRPSAPGAIDGLSDVNRYDNYCDTQLLEGYDDGIFDREAAVSHQETLRQTCEIDAGLSSGATLWLAQKVASEDLGGKQVVFISADGRASHAEKAARWTPLESWWAAGTKR